jgi:FMN-dependent NADH-azoreductase
MANLLQINSSLFGDQGNSSQLTQAFVQHWLSQHPHSQVTLRNLAAEVVPHLDAMRITALSSAAETRTAEQQAVLDYSNQLIAEIEKADAIVLGVPLYNFGVPSTLKAYFDHIARAGVTFKYTETGPVGLLSNKPVYVIAARGGIHKGLESDSQTQFLTTILNFLGLNDVHFIYAEGLSMSQKDQVFAEVKAAISQEVTA